MKVNEKIVVKIEKIVYGGEGMAYYNDFVIFVPMSCIGDIVEINIISVKKTYARGLITKIIEKSPDRVNNDAKSYCDFYMLSYEKQLEYKNIMLKDMFSKIAKIDITDIYTGIIGAQNVLNYRNKVAEPFFIDKYNIKTGFYERKSHDIYSSENDILKSNLAKKITDIVCSKLTQAKFSVYNDKKRSGFLKHLIIRTNSNNEAMVGICVYKKSQIDKLADILVQIYNEIDCVKSCYISVKNKDNNVIIGEQNLHIIGQKYISEKINDLNFKIYLDSFFQINIEQVEKLYNIAISYIKPNKNIIDAYSGTGTIAMLLSKNANKVYSIEQIQSSVNSGKIVAIENNIDNVEFICDKVENSIDKILINDNIDYIIFDPPRKGIDRSIVDYISNKQINNIIYISCEPSTFARDYLYFKEKGYILRKISAVDMFPNTHHIELVALIERMV